MGRRIKESLESILPRVARPVRYTGGEWGIVCKDLSRVDVRIALAFPDVYDIGMSNLGLRILYHVINEHEDFFAERVFAPWPDMEQEMREAGLPLFSLETFLPLADFDILGFSLAYELTYTNVLNMLDLAGIPVRSRGRGEEHPLVIAGGHCAFNPEPMAEFVDAFVIGEGESVIIEIIETYKRERASRQALLEALAEVSGVYVPSLYKAEYGEDGHYETTAPIHDNAPSRVSKRIIEDFDAAPYPEKLIVPFLETVHERAILEVMRGCTHACRFCQAGMITRPVREKSTETLKCQAEKLTASTGYDEIALTSLSSADYTGISDLVHELIDEYEANRIGVSLPSLRADAECVMLAADIERVRKTGLTFAPEAGTQRLRDVINKNVTLDDLLEAVEAAARSGWRRIKLYFMIGLPTETDEDVLGIADVVKAVLRRAKECGRPITVNVGVSSFVPKPHTPFQWRGQDDLSEVIRKFGMLKDALRIKSVTLSWHAPETSRIEAVFSRGDRQVGDAIYQAWKLGAKFDGWNEHFDYERWLQAFELAGVDPAYYANRTREHEEPLPWDHIDSGITKRYLAVQDRLADKAVTSPDCRTGECANCGISSLLPPDSDNCWKEIKERQEQILKVESEAGGSASVSSAPSQGYKQAQERYKVLLTFSKGEGARWLGHLDLLRTFERAIRRAGLPLSYSEGFNPRPRMSFASALGVGVTGGHEQAIIELCEVTDPKQVARRLTGALPEGINILEVRPLERDASKVLNPGGSEFEVVIRGIDSETLRERAERLLEQNEVIVERRKKDGRASLVNIRAEIVEVSVLESDEPRVFMRLAHGRITPKPVEVVEAITEGLPEVEPVRTHRVRLVSVAETENWKAMSNL